MRRAMLLLTVARAVLEGILLACAAALVHLVFGGRGALDIGLVATEVCGLVLVFVAVLRQQRAERQGRALTLLVLAGSVAYGLLLPARLADGLEVIARGVAFLLLGETLLWRVVSLARDPARWASVRSVISLAALVLVTVAIVPGTDQRALPLLAVLGAAAAAVGLSLARSAEELELSGATARGSASQGSATAATFFLGVAALAAALALPTLAQLAAAIGDAAARVLLPVIFVIALAVGLLAEFVYQLLSRGGASSLQLPLLPTTPADEEAARRAFESVRPLFFGSLELIFAVVAVVVALALIDRIARERRTILVSGATIEREGAGGYGVAEMLAGLFPSRPTRRRRPRDDGSPAAAIRLLYWRFLERTAATEVGWRSRGETPAEHASRARAAFPRFARAAPIVAAFERVRYGELTPAAAEVARARAALAELDTP